EVDAHRRRQRALQPEAGDLGVDEHRAVGAPHQLVGGVRLARAEGAVEPDDHGSVDCAVSPAVAARRATSRACSASRTPLRTAALMTTQATATSAAVSSSETTKSIGPG